MYGVICTQKHVSAYNFRCTSTFYKWGIALARIRHFPTPIIFYRIPLIALKAMTKKNQKTLPGIPLFLHKPYMQNNQLFQENDHHLIFVVNKYDASVMELFPNCLNFLFALPKKTYSSCNKTILRIASRSW